MLPELGAAGEAELARFVLVLLHHGVTRRLDASFAAQRSEATRQLAMELGAASYRCLLPRAPLLTRVLRETRAPWLRHLMQRKRPWRAAALRGRDPARSRAAPAFVEMFAFDCDLAREPAKLHEMLSRCRLPSLSSGVRTEALLCREETLRPSAPATGQVSALVFLRRARALDDAQMHRYWRDEHGPLVLSLRGALGFSGYQQLHAVSVATLPAATCRAAFDGVAMLTFDDARAFRSNALSPSAQRANLTLVVDEPRFIDPDAAVLVLATAWVSISKGARSCQAARQHP